MARINNINNTSASLTIAPLALSTDSFIRFFITGNNYVIGSDASNASTFTLSQSPALGTSNRLTITTDGERNLILQPAFSTNIPTTVNNVTGNGTTYTVAWTTEIFDQRLNVSGSTFTAPATGRYRISTSVWVLGINSSAFTGQVEQIVTSNRTYNGAICNPYIRSCPIGTNQNTMNNPLGVLADMDVGDTCTITYAASGGTQILDVGSQTGVGAALRGYFMGSLVC